jgi:methionine-rich copper-binding protein CopC
VGADGLIARAVLIFMGLALVAFGASDRMAPRARLVRATPAPGAVLDAPPAAVTVELSDALSATSSLAVAATITRGPDGGNVYGDGPRFTASGPDPSDVTHRRLSVALDPGLPAGLYWVQWRAVSRNGRAERNGRFAFAVGMPVPPDLADDVAGPSERDRDARRVRMALVGGVVLLVLGAFLPAGARRAR